MPLPPYLDVTLNLRLVPNSELHFSACWPEEDADDEDSMSSTSSNLGFTHGEDKASSLGDEIELEEGVVEEIPGLQEDSSHDPDASNLERIASSSTLCGEESTTQIDEAQPATTSPRIGSELIANAPLRPYHQATLDHIRPPSPASQEMREAFYRAREVIGNRASYREFLHVLNLFCRELIDRYTLFDRIGDFIGHDRILYEWFRNHLGIGRAE